ncbi:Uncharacterised protein [Vibrio cholerae]|nr:Uncharacterised protein [Vibrio cholerae]
MLFHKGFCRHWIREREIRSLTGDRGIEICIRPHINQMAGDETEEKDGR